MINEKIRQLRTLMKDNGIDIYIIPTNDYHSSENVAHNFK